MTFTPDALRQAAALRNGALAPVAEPAPVTWALNDVIADLTASLSRSLGIDTKEGYAALCEAVTTATEGWDATQQRDLFRDANGRIQSYDGLTGDPGDRADWVDLIRYNISTPLMIA